MDSKVRTALQVFMFIGHGSKGISNSLLVRLVYQDPSYGCCSVDSLSWQILLNVHTFLLTCLSTPSCVNLFEIKKYENQVNVNFECATQKGFRI